jgi:hypothetical protein
LTIRAAAKTVAETSTIAAQSTIVDHRAWWTLRANAW